MAIGQQCRFEMVHPKCIVILLGLHSIMSIKRVGVGIEQSVRMVRSRHNIIQMGMVLAQQHKFVGLLRK